MTNNLQQKTHNHLHVAFLIDLCPVRAAMPSYVLAGALLAASLAPAHASIVSFTGNLQTNATFTSCGTGCTLSPGNSDGDYAQWAAVVSDFDVSTESAMEAITFSYGGGTNGLGAVTSQGGFEPYLSLFDASGNFLASTFFGTTCPAGAKTNTNSGQCFDVLLNGGTLEAGDYQIAISAYLNISFAENLGSGTLAEGFTGLGNLAPGEDLHYAFDVILNPQTSPVPEPGSFGLPMAAALAAFGFQRLKKGTPS